MSTHRVVVARWITWGGILVLATAVLLRFREHIEQSHTVLVLLLVVLGGSMVGGRPLGFTLACAGFAVIDYLFQPPYGTLTVNKPLDLVVLVAFLATAGVTTELLSRARQEAALARRRAGEVESLAMLGAATLRRVEPADALGDVATLVRDTLSATSCTVFSCDAQQHLEPVASAPSERAGGISLGERAAARRVMDAGRSIGCDAAGQWMPVDPPAATTEQDGVVHAQLLAVPLQADARIIGVMVVRGDPILTLDVARRRFLFALAYYAALGLERMRLVGEAARSASLVEANRTKDKILASVSHDLRTPLTTIKVLAQGIESRGDPSAGAIVEQADRLARMVGDLLELSRLRAGQYAAGRELNTAEDVIGAALRRANGILGDRTIAPHTDLDAPALVGEFDFVDTLRILGNLLDNAIRHSPPRGVVDLTATRDGRWLAFTVADRGPGVAPSERERIFDAFYRPAAALPDSGHAGLGLSIARALAEVQGGTLEYADRAGGGSEFILKLPAAEVSESVASELE
ncbi:MAG TPA: ATP-binding protein [Gemmatimonadaceae bacterium]|nr:ATP-binding protein [Gemmatimonadaceae bacterium]